MQNSRFVFQIYSAKNIMRGKMEWDLYSVYANATNVDAYRWISKMLIWISNFQFYTTIFFTFECIIKLDDFFTCNLEWMTTYFELCCSP